VVVKRVGPRRRGTRKRRWQNGNPFLGLNNKRYTDERKETSLTSLTVGESGNKNKKE